MPIQQRASGVFARAQSMLNRVVSPDTRGKAYSNIYAFAHEQPLLFAFLAIQLALSSTPLILFLSFTLGVITFSLIVTLLFSLFWIGIALFILVPTLFITVSLGIVVWIWAVSSFLVARWVWAVVPVNVRGKAQIGLPNGKKAVVTKKDWGSSEGGIDAKVVDGQ